MNDGAWIEFYSSPEDSYCDPSEKFSGYSSFFEVPESGTTNIRFVHNSYSADCEYWARGFIDDIRLEKVTQLPNETMI